MTLFNRRRIAHGIQGQTSGWVVFLKNLPDKFPVLALLGRSFREFLNDDGPHLAAGLAYYALLSIFPLLLGLIAILGQFMDQESLKTEITSWAADNLPGTEEFIRDNIDTAIRRRASLGIVSALLLLWTGSAIFGAITRVVNRAWDIQQDRPFYLAKARHLAMALGVGVLFLLSTAAGSITQTAARFADDNVPVIDFAGGAAGALLFRGVSFLLALAIFLAIYKFTPNTKTRWRHIWPGALIAALLFEGAKSLFLVYIQKVASFDEIYGSIGSVIVLLLWAYVSGLILIFGAELSSEYGRMCPSANGARSVSSESNHTKATNARDRTNCCP